MKIPEYLIGLLGFTKNQIEHCALQIPDLVDEAKKRIVFAPFDKESYYVGHSGGKDSVLVRWLVDQVDSAVPTVHTPKPPGVSNEVHQSTREFLYGLNRPIFYVPEDSSVLLSSWGFKTQIDGTRAAEAARRDGRDVGVVIRGKDQSRADMPLYLEDGLFGQQFIYPIFDWTDLQVWTAIFLHEIPFTREYYVVLSGEK